MTSTHEHRPATASTGPVVRSGAARSTRNLGHRPSPCGDCGWLLVHHRPRRLRPRVERSCPVPAGRPTAPSRSRSGQLVQQHFGGNASYAIQVVVHCTDGPLTEGDGPAGPRPGQPRCSTGDSRLAEVVHPCPASASPLTAAPRSSSPAPASTPTRWSGSPTTSRQPLQDLSTRTVQVNPTGASLLWSDFNEANLHAMLKSEIVLLAGHPGRSWCSPSAPWSPPASRSS